MYQDEVTAFVDIWMSRFMILHQIMDGANSQRSAEVELDYDCRGLDLSDLKKHGYQLDSCCEGLHNLHSYNHL